MFLGEPARGRPDENIGRTDRLSEQKQSSLRGCTSSRRPFRARRCPIRMCYRSGWVCARPEPVHLLLRSVASQSARSEGFSFSRSQSHTRTAPENSRWPDGETATTSALRAALAASSRTFRIPITTKVATSPKMLSLTSLSLVGACVGQCQHLEYSAR
jgi:hypothetical protein